MAERASSAILKAYVLKPGTSCFRDCAHFTAPLLISKVKLEELQEAVTPQSHKNKDSFNV